MDSKRLLVPSPTTPVNRDFAPIAYYLETSAWSTQFGGTYAKWSDAAFHLRYGSLLLLVVLAAGGGAVLLVLLPRSTRARAGSSLCTGSMGMTMLALELFLLLGFQALYGYVFHQLSIIIAGFMLGMAAGTCLGQRCAKTGSSLRRMVLVQLAAVVLPLLLWAVLSQLAEVRAARWMAIAAQIGFPLLAALCGAVGGLQFPLASNVFFGSADSQNAGALYAFDLLGSCVGALAASLLLIPLFGLPRTAALLAFVNLCVALLAATSWMSARRNHRTPAL